MIISTNWKPEWHRLIRIAKVERYQTEAVAVLAREKQDVFRLVTVILVVKEMVAIAELRFLAAQFQQLPY